MKKFLQYAPFLLILSVSATLFVKVNQNGKDAANGFLDGSQMVGKKVADYPMEVIFPKKGKITTASFEGGYTVINLFASWCTACLYEHRFIKELKGIKGLKIIGVAWRDKDADALEWLNRNGNPYQMVGADNQGKFGIMMGVTGIPETFLIDKNGKILLHIARTVTEDDIKQIKEVVGGR